MSSFYFLLFRPPSCIALADRATIENYKKTDPVAEMVLHGRPAYSLRVSAYLDRVGLAALMSVMLPRRRLR